jgi:hypothetical protein
MNQMDVPRETPESSDADQERPPGSPGPGACSSTARSASHGTAGAVRVLLKTPNIVSDAAGRSYVLSVEPESTVGDLKRRVHLEHPFHPAPEQQRLVYGGRLLQDGECIREIVGMSRAVVGELGDDARASSCVGSNGTETGESASPPLFAVFHLVVTGERGLTSAERSTGITRDAVVSGQQLESLASIEVNSAPSTNSGEVLTFSDASRERLGSVSDAERSPALSAVAAGRQEGSSDAALFDEAWALDEGQSQPQSQQQRALDADSATTPATAWRALSNATAEQETRQPSEEQHNGTEHSRNLQHRLDAARASTNAEQASLHVRLDEQTLQLVQAYARMLRAYEEYNRCLTEYYATHEAGAVPPSYLLANHSQSSGLSASSGHGTGAAARSSISRSALEAAERHQLPGNMLRAGAAGAIPVRMIAIRVRMPALDWALVSKLTFMVILLSQDGGRDRLLLLIGLAVLIYLFQTGALGPLRRYVESLSSQLWARMQMQTLVPATGESGARPVPRNSSSASGRDASFEAAATSRQEPLSTRVLRFLRGLYLVIIAFVCSLIPTWRPPPRR